MKGILLFYAIVGTIAFFFALRQDRLSWQNFAIALIMGVLWFPMMIRETWRSEDAG